MAARGKGVFITLEGGDGTGKSTQVRMLQESLAAFGLTCITTREPGGTEDAEKIRNLLVHRDGGQWDPLSEALLFSAARREHLVGKIWPELEKGSWIVSDRFMDSTRVFQGVGHGLDRSVIEDLYSKIAGDFEPDLTIILDLPAEEGLRRSGSRGDSEDRFERLGLAFHQKLRQGFLDIAKEYPARCVVIDASQDIETIHSQIMQVISDRFLKGVAHG